MSRPRLIETEKFLGCQDRDSSRLRNFWDVETETHQDLKVLGGLWVALDGWWMVVESNFSLGQISET